MCNQEKLVTLGTHNIGQRQSKTQKTKKMSNTGPTENRGLTQVLANDKQFAFLIRHLPCYSYGQDVFDTTLCKQVQMA